MARSIQTVVSSGSLVILGVTLDYYERDDISVYFNDVAQLAGWGWVGTTDKTIVFDPAVPAGVTVKLQRRTDVDSMKHIFTSGAQFKNTNVDTNFLQLLHAVQEINERGVQPSAVGGLNMGGERISNLAPGIAASDGVNKSQMEAAIAGASALTYSGNNVGASGVGVYRDTTAGVHNFKKLVAGTNVALSDTGNTVVVNVTGGVAGEVNTATNSGSGFGLSLPKSGVNLPFRSLYAGAGIGLGYGTDNVVIWSTATGDSTIYNKYQRVRNDTGPDPTTGAINAYGWNALVRAFNADNWQVVPGMFVGQSLGGTATVWGTATEAWSGNATTIATSDVVLCGSENAVISQNPNQTKRVIGNNAVFKNRADGSEYPLGGLGANRYNTNSYAYWVTSQARGTSGEFCGWSRGLLFDADGIDSSVDGKGVAIDMAQVRLDRAECLKFPDGSVLNAGGGAVRLDANNTTDVFTVSSVVLQAVPFSTERFNIGGLGTYNPTNQRFTFAIPGVYSIDCTVMYACTSSGALSGFLFIRKNGSNADQNSLKGVHPYRSLAASQDTECRASGLLQVAAGDYINVYSYMSFTGTFAKSSNAQAITYLGIHKVA